MTAPMVTPEAVDDELGRLVAVFDEPFWSKAGWDESLRLVRPDPEHPVLGWSCCVIPGCDHRASNYGGICPVCRRRWEKTSQSMNEFISRQQQPPVAGARRRLIDRLCLVQGCPPRRTRQRAVCVTRTAPPMPRPLQRGHKRHDHPLSARTGRRPTTCPGVMHSSGMHQARGKP